MKNWMNNILNRRAAYLYRWYGPFLPLQGRVLDLGSGTGHNARFLRDEMGYPVWETDVANMNMFDKSPVLFDGKDLPFRNKTFKATLLLFVLHYASDPDAILKEALRVTQGPVILFQSTYTGITGFIAYSLRTMLFWPLACLISRLFCLIPSVTLDCAFPKYVFSGRGLRRMFRENNIKIEAYLMESKHFFNFKREIFVLREDCDEKKDIGYHSGP